MKIKSFLMLITFCFGVFILNAQTSKKGDNIVNLGLGIGTTIYSGGHYSGQVPPLSVSLEHILIDDLLDEKASLGIGGYIGYLSYKYEYSNWGWKYTNIIIGPRGYFHYYFIDKLDTYTGLLIGYNISSAKEFGSSVSGWNYNALGGGITWSWFIGGRYYFSDQIAVMLELGYGVTYLNLGVAIKL